MRPNLPVATLGQLMNSPDDWMWLIWQNCLHCVAVSLADAVAHFGADTSSDVLRQRTRCSRCGGRGAQLQAPSWSVNRAGGPGYSPIPDERLVFEVQPAAPGLDGAKR